MTTLQDAPHLTAGIAPASLPSEQPSIRGRGETIMARLAAKARGIAAAPEGVRREIPRKTIKSAGIGLIAVASPMSLRAL